MTVSVPTFYLYGEPRRVVDEHFVHVESLDDRTRPSEWTIRPHAHADLNHLFLVSNGGGTMHVDGDVLTFGAPCLLVIPAGVVHGFNWDVESSGAVVTVATSYLADLVERDKDLSGIFEQPTVVSAPAGRIERQIAVLRYELGWAAPGHRASIDAQLLALLVAVIRQTGPRQASAEAPGRDAALVARFRARVEERFRSREPVETHARALGVSARRLRQACSSVARQPPTEILDQRTVLEAKRMLIYGHLTVAQTGETLGFEDAAYFSRFFRRHAGVAPGFFRRGRNSSVKI